MRAWKKPAVAMPWCGWTVAEAVAGAAFGAAAVCLVSSAVGGSVCSDAPGWVGEGAASVLLFLAFWLTLWTIGGIAAWTHLLRSVWGEDRMQLVPDGLGLVRRAGPFRRVRTFDRRAIRRVRLRRRDNALVLDTSADIEVLTAFGTIAERAAIRTWLQDGLRLTDEGTARADAHTPPAGCEVDREGAGWRLVPPLRTRRIQALVMWIVTGVVCLGWWSGARTNPPGNLQILSLLLPLAAAGAAWLSWGRTEWILKAGELRFRRRLGSWSREQSFAAPARLEITHHTDSDGDDHFTLVVRAGTVRRTIVKSMPDPDQVLHFAHWLASRTGLPLDVPAGLEP